MPALARRAPLADARPGKVPQGIVTAIVAVTGVEDKVGDVILPGAFARTLSLVRPKVVFHHDWLRFLGRTLLVTELMPGDPGLPKQTKDGKPWPKQAGALVATMQFNLRTQAGRDGYEWARFYTESNECEWSIGYKVVLPKTTQGADGIRYIGDLDVYEFSLVLFGAAPLSMTLSTKSGELHDELEYKATPAFAAVDLDSLEVKAAESATGSGIMVALYPPKDVAAGLAVPDGSPAEELHVTLVYLGRTDTFGIGGEQLLIDTVRGAVTGAEPLDGTLGGLGQFPAGPDGTPVYVPVDVPGLSALRERIVAAIKTTPDLAEQVHENHGFTPHLTLGYDVADAQPAPPTPVAFGDVYVVWGSSRTPIPLGVSAPAGPTDDFEDAAAGDEPDLAATVTGKAWQTVRDALSGAPGMEGKLLPGGGLQTAQQPTASDLLRDRAAASRGPSTAPQAAPKQRASNANGGFDPNLHPRGAKGQSNGGQFISRGSGYSSAGKGGQASDVTSAQQALIKGGFLHAGAGQGGKGDDGLFGPQTEAAVRAWQKANGYPETGKLNGTQMTKLTGSGLSSPSTRRASGSGTTRASSAAAKKPPAYRLDGAGRKPGDPDYGNSPGYHRDGSPDPGTAPKDTSWDAQSQRWVKNPKAVKPRRATASERAAYLAGMHGAPQPPTRTQPDTLGRLPGNPDYGSDPGYHADGTPIHAQPDALGRLPGDPDYGSDPGFHADGTPDPKTQRKSAWLAVMEAKGMSPAGGARSLVDQLKLEGKYDTSPVGTPGGKPNWVDKVGGQPDFFRAIVHALMRNGHDESSAERIAVGTCKRWAHGGGNVTAKTRAKAAEAVAQWERMKAQSHAQTAAKTAAKGAAREGKQLLANLEGKHMGQQDMPGSYEERQEQLRSAVRAKLCKKTKPTGASNGEIRAADDWACVESTFDDHVIASYTSGDKPAQSFSIPYTVVNDDVVLGEPEPVTLTVLALPDSDPDGDGDSAGDTDGDGDGADGDVDADDAMTVRFVMPAAGMIGDATDLLRVGGGPLQGKHLENLRDSVLDLLDLLAVKGLPLDELDDETSEPAADDEADEPDPEPGPDESAAADPDADGDTGPDSDSDGDGAVTMDPAEVRRQLAELSA